MVGFLVKWTGVVILCWVVYAISTRLGAAQFTVVTIGQMGFTLAFILTGLMFIMAARVAVKG